MIGGSSRIIFSLFICHVARASAGDCCPRKKVGEYYYTFLDQSDRAGGAGCKTDCVYLRDDLGPDREWCFGPGELQPECDDINCYHPCNRPCSSSSPMVCNYTFISRPQYSDAPGRRADGRNRTVLTFNEVLPGPLIVVCEGDTVNVHLKNLIEDGPVTNADGSPDETTLHFHGIREVGRTVDDEVFGPWSDGVPYVTQCPVDFKKSFTYTFFAGRQGDKMNAPPGTYWYHSHVGAQRTNGLQGGLIIKDRKGFPLGFPFEYGDVIDIPCKQTLLVQEWYEETTCQAPVSILINGKGRVSAVSSDTQDMCKKNNCSNPEKTNRYLKGVGETLDAVETECPDDDGYAEFTAEPDTLYRFRIVGMIGQNLPMRFTVKKTETEHLPFAVIASDSLYIKPIENVTYIWLSAGERYDIILRTPEATGVQKNAVQFRFSTFTQFNASEDPNSSQMCTIAYLKTGDFSKIDPNYRLPFTCSEAKFNPNIYDGPFKRVLNAYPRRPETFLPPQRLGFPEWEDTSSTGYIYPIDMRSFETFVNAGVVNKGNPEFIEFGGGTTFNHIRTTFPQIPYLLQKSGSQDTKYHSQGGPRCNSTDKPSENQGYYSACNHVLQFPFKEDGWAEMILINNNAAGAAHPIHQHGGELF